MKTSRRLLSGPILFFALSLFAPVAESRAEDVVISQFNDAGGLWRFDYGGVTNLIEYDASQEASNNPASGSMKVTFGFDAAALNPAGNNKGAVTIDLSPPLDGSTYLTMEMDVKIETGSAADGGGNSAFSKWSSATRQTLTSTRSSEPT